MSREEIGVIYILSNRAMPGMVKIGFTAKGEAEVRAAELSATVAVPLPFKVEHSLIVENPRRTEQRIHDKLRSMRVSTKREFFRLEVDDAIDSVNAVIFGTDSPDDVFIEGIRMLLDLRDKYPQRFSRDLPEKGVNEIREMLDKHQRNDD